MRVKSLALAASAVAFTAAQDLATVLSGQPSLSMLVELLGTVPNTTESIASQKDVTLFAPNNKASSTILGSGGIFSVGQAGADPGLIEQILDYHLFKGVVVAADISEVPLFPNSYLDYSGIVLDGGESGSNVTGGQVVSVSLDTDGNAIVTSGLKAISNIVVADLEFDNGVIHIIDKLLLIPMSVGETLTSGGFTALAGAATELDLVTTLDELHDVTIFVPNNDAFRKIAGGTASITEKQLADILQYHVVQGAVAYSTVIAELGNTTIEALNGGNLEVTIDDNGAVFVDSARVINADILIANGVMHVIDEVLIPGNPDAEPPSSTAVSTPYASAFTPDPRFTVVETELVQTTSFVAAGLVTATATTAPSNWSSATASSGVVPATGGADVRNTLPGVAAALVGALAFAAQL